MKTVVTVLLSVAVVMLIIKSLMSWIWLILAIACVVLLGIIALRRGASRTFKSG